jgi:hypothetical protein
MPFNATTYRANKAARSARSYLDKARDIKSRATLGQAYAWEIERIPTLVSWARSDMRLCRIYRRLKDLGQ